MSSEIRTTRLCADLGKSLKNFMQYTFPIDASKKNLERNPRSNKRTGRLELEKFYYLFV